MDACDSRTLEAMQQANDTLTAWQDKTRHIPLTEENAPLLYRLRGYALYMFWKLVKENESVAQMVANTARQYLKDFIGSPCWSSTNSKVHQQLLMSSCTD